LRDWRASVWPGACRLLLLLRQSAGILSIAQGEKMAAAKITVNHNGSIRIEGDFEIVDPLGNPFGLAGRTVVSLCRCGHSANKPFCDGSHKTSGFADTVAARELPPPKPKL
jgi:CDGSH-type Zn-finger protein